VLVHPLRARRVRVGAIGSAEPRGELLLLAPHALGHILGFAGKGEFPAHAGSIGYLFQIST